MGKVRQKKNYKSGLFFMWFRVFHGENMLIFGPERKM